MIWWFCYRHSGSTMVAFWWWWKWSVPLQIVWTWLPLAWKSASSLASGMWKGGSVPVSTVSNTNEAQTQPPAPCPKTCWQQFSFLPVNMCVCVCVSVQAHQVACPVLFTCLSVYRVSLYNLVRIAWNISLCCFTL